MTYTAKIYKITCSCCDKIYIGSTKQAKLCKRMSGHRQNSKETTNSKFYIHMREQGFDKFTIMLIESVEVEDVDELRKLENDKIEEFDTIKNGFNSRRSYQSQEVKKAIKKKSDHKYRSQRKNMDAHNEYRKIYRANPKQTYECECCGYSTGRIDTYKRHLKSKRHIEKAT